MIKPIQGIAPIAFKYKWQIKDEWKKGNLPTVQFDIYGDKIVKPTVEHIIAKSKGGASSACNYAIANELSNQLRGNEPILKYTTIENIVNWVKQFIGVKTAKVDGNAYIKEATNYLAKNGIKLDIKV